MYEGRPTEIELQFDSESVPIVLEVDVRSAEFLPAGPRGDIDPFVRVHIAGQVAFHFFHCSCEY